MPSQRRSITPLVLLVLAACVDASAPEPALTLADVAGYWVSVVRPQQTVPSSWVDSVLSYGGDLIVEPGGGYALRHRARTATLFSTVSRGTARVVGRSLTLTDTVRRERPTIAPFAWRSDTLRVYDATNRWTWVYVRR